MLDHHRFDILAQSLARRGTRRGLVRLLAFMPLGATLVALLIDEPTLADGSVAIVGGGNRRRGRNHHRHNSRRRHRTTKHQGKRKGKTCGATTCRNGCCAGKTCRQGTISEACGSGGGACTACTGPGQTCCGQTCKSGANVLCSANDQCCSGSCPAPNHSFLGCCPTCPTGCSCAVTFGARSLELVCVQTPNSTLCRESSDCQPGETCVIRGPLEAGNCAVLCTPLS